MKSMKRRLLSLFMAMVMVCTLAPAALAVDPPVPSDATWEEGTSLCTNGSQHANYTYTQTTATCTTAGSETWECPTCHAKATKTIEKLPHTPKTGSLTETDYNKDDSKHYVQCTVCGQNADEGTAHTYDVTTNKCVCGRENPNIPATAIGLNATELMLTVNEEKPLTATLTPANATTQVVWESSDATVAAYLNGKVKGIKAGEATITAKAGNLTATCAVTVTPPVVTPEIEIVSQPSTIYSGTSVTLRLKNAPANSTVTWTTTSRGISISEYNTTTADGMITVEILDSALTGSHRITASINGTQNSYTKDIPVRSPLSITVSPNSNAMTSYDSYKILTVSLANEKRINSIYWEISSGTNYVELSQNSGSASVYVYPRAYGTATIRATVTDVDGHTYTATQDVSVNISSDITPSVTVYESNPGYVLSDTPDEGSSSVAEQIASRVKTLMRNTSYNYYTVHFTTSGNTTNGYLNASTGSSYEYDSELDDVEFEPEVTLSSSKPTATSSYNFKVYVYSSNGTRISTFDGTVTFNIKQGTSSSGDVIFYGDAGKDVSFDSISFEDFWDDVYPGGDLDYVTFSPSGGTLYDSENKKVSSSKYCYVSPRKSDIGLDDLYFTPSSSKATTITFSFTAYGENKTGSKKEALGKVSIVYMSGSPKDISYTVGSNGTVSLKASDFTDAYKEVISGSVPSNLTIVFQEAPRNGTLTYTDSSKSRPSEVKLTNSNIKSRSFTTKSSGTNQLNDIVYSGTSGTDTIEYTAYSGSTPKFRGKVVFNGAAPVPTDVVVTYGSTGGQAVQFSQNDFVKANSVMSNAVKVRFTVPANGTLQMGGANAAGIDVAASLLNSVSYKPNAGYNSTERIIFAAYDARSNLVASGSVNITMVGNPAGANPGTNPGANPGGVTDVSQFKDVSATAWYRSDLATLVSQGIITGKGEGKFDPKGTVTYGEALKMILEACGHTAAVGTGSNWAINYKNLAVSNDWISSSVDLNAPITRNATAELAAKVMGVSPATGGSPFADEANAYAVALYYTTPQIFVGSANPNGGKPLFENNMPLLREQVCAVICRVRNYHTQNNIVDAMPDGL